MFSRLKTGCLSPPPLRQATKQEADAVRAVLDLLHFDGLPTRASSWQGDSQKGDDGKERYAEGDAASGVVCLGLDEDTSDSMDSPLGF